MENEQTQTNEAKQVDYDKLGLKPKVVERLKRRSRFFGRNKELEPIMKEYLEALNPQNKRELQLVKRIVELQLQINKDMNVDTSKRLAARLIKRVVGKKTNV